MLIWPDLQIALFRELLFRPNSLYRVFDFLSIPESSSAPVTILFQGE